jgi:hypothetical protein
VKASIRLNQHPLTTTLDELIKHKSHISQGKATDVEAEELGRVSGAEFQTDVGWGGVLESWIFDLLGDLICDGQKMIKKDSMLVLATYL